MWKERFPCKSDYKDVPSNLDYLKGKTNAMRAKELSGKTKLAKPYEPDSG
jgi:hypothetical protein